MNILMQRSSKPRKIIHVDQDCFYAAIEMRERGIPREVPVAVGGSSERGVLTTCNYKAREYGCHSAMPIFKALKRCPELKLLPVNFALYGEESQKIRSIFKRYTSLIEPLSLDEAHLDVSELKQSGWEIAQDIRKAIRKELRLPSSAGIGPNKMLAKIASDWNKPNGQFEVKPEGVADFMFGLPIRKIHGVGPKMAQKLEARGVKTCGDLQQLSLADLVRDYQSWGAGLYQLCRGIDDRPVEPDRLRKSCSTERTFQENIETLAELLERVPSLYQELMEDIQKSKKANEITGVFCKVKFADFTTTTVARAHVPPSIKTFESLIAEGKARAEKPVRLLGLGVRFQTVELSYEQLELELIGQKRIGVAD